MCARKYLERQRHYRKFLLARKCAATIRGEKAAPGHRSCWFCIKEDRLRYIKAKAENSPNWIERQLPTHFCAFHPQRPVSKDRRTYCSQCAAERREWRLNRSRVVSKILRGLGGALLTTHTSHLTPGQSGPDRHRHRHERADRRFIIKFLLRN